MNNRFSSIVIGIIFIVFGVSILLDKLGFIYFTWDDAFPFVLIALSVLSFISVARGNKSNAFWGTTLGLLGVFFFLHNYEIIPYLWIGETWPVYLIAIGLGFIVLYFFKPKDWGVLIPGGILTFLGLIFFLQTMDMSWYTIRFLKNFWPLILILIGLGLIGSSLDRRANK
ncbi:hypothetical protein JXQ31_05045 [candidate division KSB1 bacterium]|nr:hypothetical protein [candidate division KSB1 bacterium]